MSPTQGSSAVTGGERRASLAGVDTRQVEIDGEGPPLLLIHGYADSADTWRPLLERLARADRAAAAFDLSGFGTAEALDPAELLLPQWDAMVEAAVRELSERHGGSEVIIVGNSLGGASRCARPSATDLPIAGIVPIAPAGLHMARWFSVIESERLVRLLRISPVPVPERIVKPIVGRVYRSLVFRDPRAADPGTSRRSLATSGASPRAWGCSTSAAGCCPSCETRSSCGDRLPAAAGLGRARPDGVHDRGRAGARTVDYSDIEMIPSCGHCPQLEVPDVLAELLLGFPGNLEYAPPAERAG